MSHEGKMRRGEKWYSYRDLDSKLPKEIADDVNKMSDVNYYLEQSKKSTEVKKEEKKEVTKTEKKGK